MGKRHTKCSFLKIFKNYYGTFGFIGHMLQEALAFVKRVKMLFPQYTLGVLMPLPAYASSLKQGRGEDHLRYSKIVS